MAYIYKTNMRFKQNKINIFKGYIVPTKMSFPIKRTKKKYERNPIFHVQDNPIRNWSQNLG